MNSYTLFKEPKKTFKEIFSELKKAKKSIYIEAYELKNDQISRELFRILARKSLEVKVIIIVDDFGFKTPSKETKKLIDESKIEFNIFNPVWNALKEKHISKISRFVLRSHRKLTIIDERLAYTGGTNYTAQEILWRDIFVKIKGPLVADLTRSFFEMRRLTKSKLTIKQPINKKLTKKFKNKDIVVRQIPHSFHRPLHSELTSLFANAKKEIVLTTPYFVPTVQLLFMMYKAIRRGINLKILIPEKSDHYWVDIVSDFFANILFRNKAKVYLQKQMSHAKYIVFDNDVCTFGSANFDYQTFYNNHELNIISNNKEIVSDLKNLFNDDSKKSIIFNDKTRRNKKFIRKIFEKIINPFKKYF